MWRSSVVGILEMFYVSFLLGIVIILSFIGKIEFCFLMVDLGSKI